MKRYIAKTRRCLESHCVLSDILTEAASPFMSEGIKVGPISGHYVAHVLRCITTTTNTRDTVDVYLKL